MESAPITKREDNQKVKQLQYQWMGRPITKREDNNKNFYNNKNNGEGGNNKKRRQPKSKTITISMDSTANNEKGR